MSGTLRGQEGFPTDQECGPAGSVDQNIVREMPSADDWQHPEQAEAALEATREALAQ